MRSHDVQETYVNATENHIIGESPSTPIEGTVLEGMTIGEMFRWFRHEYGRCTSKIGMDTETGTIYPIGWVFQKREKYEDEPRQFYLHETWIMLIDRDETVWTVDYHRLDEAVA